MEERAEEAPHSAAQGLQVLELVMSAAGGGLSWALGGEGKHGRGIRLWPLPAGGVTGASSSPREQQLLLDEQALRALDDQEGPGYFIRDGLMGEVTARTVRGEVEALRGQGLLRPASMHSHTHAKWSHERVRGDEHVWLDLRGLDESAHDQEESQANRSWWEERPALRRVCQRLRDVRDELCRVWGLPQGPAQVQLACYPGHNARYVRHLDEPRTGSGRKLTLLYYINPDWESADGGCLRLYPKKPQPSATDDTLQQEVPAEHYVDVEPRADRLLMFQSRTIEHEVLPVHAPRFSLTMWLY